MGIAKQKLCRNGQVNEFMVSVKSGAKGTLFNVCQMTGMLGQQYINSARLSDPSMTIQYLYQKVFITGLFGTGLTPTELFSHAQSGRISLCDTALTTSQTGYSQLGLIKLMEGLIVYNDDSVRCCYTNKKYEVCFGTDSIDPSRKGVDKMCLARAIYRATMQQTRLW